MYYIDLRRAHEVHFLRSFGDHGRRKSQLASIYPGI